MSSSDNKQQNSKYRLIEREPLQLSCFRFVDGVSAYYEAIEPDADAVCKHQPPIPNPKCRSLWVVSAIDNVGRHSSLRHGRTPSRSRKSFGIDGLLFLYSGAFAKTHQSLPPFPRLAARELHKHLVVTPEQFRKDYSHFAPSINVAHDHASNASECQHRT